MVDTNKLNTFSKIDTIFDFAKWMVIFLMTNCIITIVTISLFNKISLLWIWLLVETIINLLISCVFVCEFFTCPILEKHITLTRTSTYRIIALSVCTFTKISVFIWGCITLILNQHINYDPHNMTDVQNEHNIYVYSIYTISLQSLVYIYALLSSCYFVLKTTKV
jgi:hypothetical protein